MARTQITIFDKSINCNFVPITLQYPVPDMSFDLIVFFVSTYLCVILSPPLTVVWSPSKTYPHLKSMYVSSCYPPISLISSKDLKILLNCIWEYSTKYILGHFEKQWKITIFNCIFKCLQSYSVSFFMNFIHSFRAWTVCYNSFIHIYWRVLEYDSNNFPRVFFITICWYYYTSILHTLIA